MGHLHRHLHPEGLLEASEDDGALETLLQMRMHFHLWAASQGTHPSHGELLEVARGDEELELKQECSHLKQDGSDSVDPAQKTVACAEGSSGTSDVFEAGVDGARVGEACQELLPLHPRPCISPV